MTLFLAIFAIMFVAIGSACAADINSDVISDKNLNSEDIIANSNGIDNSNKVIDSQGSQISVDNAKETYNSNVDSVSASNVKESSETKNVNINVEPSNNVKANTAITNVGATTNTVTVAQVISAASSVKTYVEKNKALPSSVTVGSVSVSSAKFAYLESMAVQLLNSGKSTSTKITILSVSGSSATYTINKNPTKATYVSVAKTVSSDCSSKKALPSYVTVSSAKADSRVYTYAFAKILVFYKNNNNRLPNTCTFDSSVFKSTPTPVTTSVTVAQVISAASSVKTYVEKNKALPSSVTVGSVSVSSAKFAYLESMAVQYLNSGKSTSTKITVLNVSGSSATYTINKNPTKSAYVSVAKTVSSDCSSKKALPSYVTVSSAKADSRVYTYAFAKILVFYKNNKNTLPNTCTFDSSVFKSTPTPVTTSFTISEIITAAGNLKTYVEKNKALPSTVTVGSTKLTMAQFVSLEPAAVQMLSEGKSTSTKISVINASGTTTKYTIDKNPTKATYVNVAKSVYNYFKTNKVAPAYATVDSGKADYRVYSYAFAKILVFYKNNNNRLPNTCTFQSSVFESTPGPDPSGLVYKKGVNEKITEKDLSAYLKYYTRDKANDAIKSLAKSLTKNCKNDLEKATVLFNYVRDHVSYSFYYNSVYYATGTYSRKSANCCDKSNLLVSLYKSAGLASRYCHATSCTFSSGLRVGHVWTQVYVNGVWYVGDATSSRNSLGHVNNWNLNSMSGLNQYAALPF